jgi:N-methylhydantoinase B
VTRHPDHVARDVREGLLTRDQASAIYRVVINNAGDVDAAATARLREPAR